MRASPHITTLAPPRRCPRRHGFTTIDAVFAIGLLFTLAMGLGYAVNHHRHAVDRLSDRRALVRQAEQILTHLHTAPAGDLSAAAAPDDVNVGHTWDIEPLDDPPHDERAVWVRVTVEDKRGQRETLVGQVPHAHNPTAEDAP